MYRTLLVILVPSLLVFSPSVKAQDRLTRSALELAFDHGVSQLREPGEEVTWTGANAALDVRLHAPSGFGGTLRAGTTLGAIFTLELDTGPTYRAWVMRNGPRGLTFGGGAGASLYWNATATDASGPNGGVETHLAAGGFATVQLDYHEESFFVGIAYQTRWLPLRDHGEGLDTFSFSACARVGGEITL